MSVNYTYWQEPDGMWLGYINDYPDYMTEGHTLDELKSMLLDVLENVRTGVLPAPAVKRNTGVLELA